MILQSNELIFGLQYSEEKNDFIFYVPPLLMDMQLSEIQKFKFLHHILRKYSYNKILNKESDEKFFNDMNDNHQIMMQAYVFLLKDHENNGDLILKHKEKHDSAQNVNWSKSMRSPPIISNKNIIHHLHREGKYQIFDHEFYKIYQEAIRRAKLYIHGIYEEPQVFPKDKQHKSIILNYEEQHFSDRDKEIVKYLKIIFLKKKIALNVKNDYPYLTKTFQFHHVWQDMIKNILPYTEDVKLKKGIYKSKGGAGLSMLPDHILYDELKYYILDSKFYDIKKNLPASQDISKQILYKYALWEQLKKEKNKDFDIKNIENIFIFPSHEKELKTFDIHEHDCEHFKIDCVSINFQDVMQLYLQDKKYEYFIKDLYKDKILIINNKNFEIEIPDIQDLKSQVTQSYKSKNYKRTYQEINQRRKIWK